MALTTACDVTNTGSLNAPTQTQTGPATVCGGTHRLAQAVLLLQVGEDILGAVRSVPLVQVGEDDRRACQQQWDNVIRRADTFNTTPARDLQYVSVQSEPGPSSPVLFLKLCAVVAH